MAENYIKRQEEQGSINISEDVIAVIVGAAVSEVDGVAGLANTAGSELADFLNKKSVSKGVKVCFDEDRIVTDVIIMIRYGYKITDVAKKVQESVAVAIESMASLKAEVNVHISGIALDK